MNLYREFRFTSGTSNKTWIVHAPRPTTPTSHAGGIVAFWAVTCKWGRIGNNLQGITKYFSTKSDAENFVSDKVSEKLGKGYKEYLKPPVNLDVAFDKAKAYVAASAPPKCEHNNLTRQQNGWKCINCQESVEFEKKAACPVTQLEAVRYFNLEDL